MANGQRTAATSVAPNTPHLIKSIATTSRTLKLLGAGSQPMRISVSAPRAVVNGVPKLTCAAFLRDFAPGPIRVEALQHFPIERDLVTTLDDFMEKLEFVTPWIVRKEAEPPLEEGEYKQSPAELAAFKQYSMCINCMLCYAACPVYGQEPEFVGPAALALAQRYNLDSRDEGNDLRSLVIGSQNGVWDCTFVNECSEVCPKHVDPAGAIQQLKLVSAIDWFESIPSRLGRKSEK